MCKKQIPFDPVLWPLTGYKYPLHIIYDSGREWTQYMGPGRPKFSVKLANDIEGWICVENGHGNEYLLKIKKVNQGWIGIRPEHIDQGSLRWHFEDNEKYFYLFLLVEQKVL
jgi:hypothetical protein